MESILRADGKAETLKILGFLSFSIENQSEVVFSGTWGDFAGRIEDHRLSRVSSSSHFIMFSIVLISYQFSMMF